MLESLLSSPNLTGPSAASTVFLASHSPTVLTCVALLSPVQPPPRISPAPDVVTIHGAAGAPFRTGR